jgi:hypothetical protein
MLCFLGCEFSILTFANAQPTTLNPKTLRLPTKVGCIASPYPFCVPVNESANVAFKVTRALWKNFSVTTALEMREPEKNENRQKQLGRQNQSPRPKTHNRREFAKPLERENGSR